MTDREFISLRNGALETAVSDPQGLVDVGEGLSPKPAAPSGSAAIPVLLMARQLDFGGIERDVSKFARHLGKYGVSPHVACFNPGGIRWREIVAAGIPVLPLPVTSFKSRSAFIGARTLKRYLAEHHIQVVHAFDDPTSVFGNVVARLARVPVTLSSQLGSRDLSRLRTRMLMTIADRIATAHFVNCQAMAEELAGSWNVSRNRIHVCYNGFEPEEFHANNRVRPPHLADASVVIGTVALLRPEKNLPMLIEAFARVREADPQARLLIVGSGPLKGELERRIQDLNLASACILQEASSTPAEWMRAMDIFVLPSRMEAFSNALLEAMACGCCPVGSRVGGTPELIRHGERGILFEPGNGEQLAEALRTLLLDPGLRRRMAQAAARFAHESLTIDIAASRLASIYRDLLRQRGCGHLSSDQHRSA
ncbi:MAG TPA: glycosyltransferase family 4 protein [Terriglobales bacterium]|nr:glycosyltransferase family 4 protein [Terriglobales bacterium]